MERVNSYQTENASKRERAKRTKNTPLDAVLPNKTSVDNHDYSRIIYDSIAEVAARVNIESTTLMESRVKQAISDAENDEKN